MKRDLEICTITSYCYRLWFLYQINLDPFPLLQLASQCHVLMLMTTKIGLRG